MSRLLAVPAVAAVAVSALLLLLPLLPGPVAAADDYSDAGTGDHHASRDESAWRPRGWGVGQRSRLQSRRALQQHVQQLLRQCPLPGYCRHPAGLPTAEQFVAGEPQKPEMAEQKKKVAAFIEGNGLQARLKQLKKLPDRQGILISAGKPHHVGGAAVILHVLRRNLGCHLPVEIAHVGDGELDPTTRATLAAAFPPLHFLDLNSSATRDAYPAHHRQDFKLDRYEPKILALYFTRFQQVLLLDADNLPLLDPSQLFSSPHMARHGNMLWMDLWSPLHSSTTFVGQPTVWHLLGLNKGPFWDVLAGGQGHVRRVAESGQLLLDRVAHADVLEYLWWLNSFSDVLYHHVLGDKDSFAFAFAAAGKLHDMAFVAVPPGAAFRHQAADAKHAIPTWHFVGMTQYNHQGEVAFFHRTLAKWDDASELPPPLDVLTGPLPNRFIWSYLGNKTTGFTPDIPEHTLRPVRLNCPRPQAHFVQSEAGTPASTYAAAPALGSAQGGCNLGLLFEYLTLRDWGLPVMQQPELIKTCRQAVGLLQKLMRLPADGGDDAKAQAVGQGVAAATQALQRQLRQAATTGSGGSNSSGSVNSGSLWAGGHVHEFVWLRNCRLLQQQQQDQPDTKAAAAAVDWAGPVNCSAASWHVARYMLYEHAEKMATDSNGNLQPDVQPRLPVVLLNNVSPIGAQGGSGSDKSDGGCGAWCSIDVLQQRVLPAAVAWVRENWEQLPLLKEAKEKREKQQQKRPL